MYIEGSTAEFCHEKHQKNTTKCWRNARVPSLRLKGIICIKFHRLIRLNGQKYDKMRSTQLLWQYSFNFKIIEST